MEKTTIKLSERPTVCQMVNFTEGCESVTWVGDEITLVGDYDIIERTVDNFCCEGFL